MTPRRRLDEALVDRQLAANRSRARALVMAGRVKVDGAPAAKAGMAVDTDAELEVVETPPFVGRGGEKLAAALEATALDVSGAVCLDVGASTGGFTDCLLQSGAAHVIALDVGHGQLDWRLRNDARVHPVERCNARYLRVDDLPAGLPAPRILTVDVSFIGVGKLLGAVSAVCAEEAEGLVLVKPQFECGPERVAAGGVVRTAADRRAAVEAVARQCRDAGWSVVAAVPSPIRGASGNWECFLQLQRPPTGDADPAGAVAAVEVPDDRRAGGGAEDPS